MRLLSAIPGDVAVPVKAPRPIQMSDQEMVFPARRVVITCGQPLDLPDDEGEVILKARGRAGVVQIPQSAMAEDIPGLMSEARALRFTHLRRLLDGYRIEQGMRQASGRELLPPTEGMRRALVESNKLQKDMVDSDPVAKELMGSVPTGDALKALKETQQMAPDVSGLEEFGIPAKAAPLMPGVTAWDETLPAL